MSVFYKRPTTVYDKKLMGSAGGVLGLGSGVFKRGTSTKWVVFWALVLFRKGHHIIPLDRRAGWLLPWGHCIVMGSHICCILPPPYLILLSHDPTCIFTSVGVQVRSDPVSTSWKALTERAERYYVYGSCHSLGDADDMDYRWSPAAVGHKHEAFRKMCSDTSYAMEAVCNLPCSMLQIVFSVRTNMQTSMSRRAWS